jgi:hypothetical protein
MGTNWVAADRNPLTNQHVRGESPRQLSQAVDFEAPDEEGFSQFGFSLLS